ncbi:MAG: hypothetical protein ACFFD8_03140 [Candidatus Thorarchaeota archaeon]
MITFELSPEILEGLETKAKDANISIEAAAQLILSEFVRVYGSGIYTGSWRRGDKEGKKGRRYVIDWPFQPGFVKIPGDQSIDLGKGIRTKED